MPELDTSWKSWIQTNSDRGSDTTELCLQFKNLHLFNKIFSLTII